MIAETLQASIAPTIGKKLAVIGEVNNPIPRTFIATTDGTITFDSLEGENDVPVPVIGGVMYPTRILKLTASTAGAVVLQW